MDMYDFEPKEDLHFIKNTQLFYTGGYITYALIPLYLQNFCPTFLIISFKKNVLFTLTIS